MLARLLLIGLVVAACGGPSPTAPVSTPSYDLEPSHGCWFAPSSPTANGPSPGCTTPQLADTPAPSAVSLSELPPAGTDLEPGRYSRSSFEPAIEFTVGDGWTTEQQTAGFFDIQDEPGSLDVVAVQFGNVIGADDAAGAAADISSSDNLSVSEPENVKIDGLPGVRLLIETTDPVDANPPPFRPVITLTPGPVSIASARRLDLTLLDVEGSVLAIMMGGSIAEWERALEVATPVIESVTIGDQ